MGSKVDMEGKWQKIIFRFFLSCVTVLILAVFVLKTGCEKGLIHPHGLSFKLGTTTVTGFLVVVFCKLFDALGANALWDAIKAIFGGNNRDGAGGTSLDTKNEAMILDEYKIEKEQFGMVRYHSELYVDAVAFAREGSDRIKAESALRELKPGQSSLIGLYASTSCGRQALVYAGLREQVCPVLVLKAYEFDVSSIRKRIVGYINDSHHFTDGTFYVKVARMLSADECCELMKVLSRTVHDAENDRKTLRIIVSFNCLEDLQMGDVGLLFHLTILNANESNKLLSVVAAKCATPQHPNLIKELAQAYPGARLGRFVYAYSQGNPIGIVKFVKVFQAKVGRIDSPLVAMERGWHKTTLHLKLADRERTVAQAVLHFILTMSAGGDMRCVDLGPIIDDLCGGKGATGDYAMIQSFLAAVLPLPEHVSLRPFDLRRIVYDDFRYDPYVFSCGEFDLVKYSDAWQSMFTCVLSHPSMKEYRSAFCDGLVSAAIRSEIVNALPYQQSPRLAYSLAPVVLSRVLSIKFAADSVKRDVEKFVRDIQEKVWRRVADGVIEYLALRFDNLMPDEIRNVIKEDLDTCDSDDDYLWRLGELLPFMIAGCPDPIGWVVNIDDLSVRADRLIKSSTSASSDVVFAFSRLLEAALIAAHSFLAFNERVFQKWMDIAHSMRTRATDSITDRMRKLTMIIDECERLLKENEILQIVDRMKDVLQAVGQDAKKDDAPHAIFAFSSIIGFADRLLQLGNNKISEMLLDDVRKALEECPLLLLSVRKWFLPRVLHALAMRQAVQLPTDCSAESLHGFYCRVRNKMDVISARYGFDGENRPRFLISLAFSVDDLMSRYRAQREYEVVLQQELHYILLDVMAVKDAVNYQDLMQIMILMSQHFNLCNKTEQAWLCELWEDIDRKIPRMSGEIGWMSLVEIVAFAKCAVYIMTDQDFAKKHFTAVFLEKIANSAILGLMTDNAKLIWAESLFPSFAPYDLTNISVRLARIALGEERLMPACPTSDGKIIPEMLVRYFIENRHKILSDTLNRTDLVFDNMILSVSQYVASGYFKTIDISIKKGLVASVKWVLENYVLPAAKAAGSGVISFRPRDVANLSTLFSCIASTEVDMDEIPGLETLMGEVMVFLESDSGRKVVNSVFGGDVSVSERAVTILKSIETRAQIDQLVCIANIALSGLPISDFSEFECQGSARQLYKLAYSAFTALSTEALQNVGYVAYDNIIENLFAQDEKFITTNPDLVPEILQYVQKELSKRRNSQVIKRLVKVLNKGMRK